MEDPAVEQVLDEAEGNQASQHGSECSQPRPLMTAGTGGKQGNRQAAGERKLEPVIEARRGHPDDAVERRRCEPAQGNPKLCGARREWVSSKIVQGSSSTKSGQRVSARRDTLWQTRARIALIRR